jgi:hypothetical protein
MGSTSWRIGKSFIYPSAGFIGNIANFKLIATTN